MDFSSSLFSSSSNFAESDMVENLSTPSQLTNGEVDFVVVTQGEDAARTRLVGTMKPVQQVASNGKTVVAAIRTGILLGRAIMPSYNSNKI